MQINRVYVYDQAKVHAICVKLHEIGVHLGFEHGKFYGTTLIENRKTFVVFELEESRINKLPVADTVEYICKKLEVRLPIHKVTL
jgi:hypothetical protein